MKHLFLFLVLLCSSGLAGQDTLNPAQHQQLAEELSAKGEHYRAAGHYLSAQSLFNKKEVQFLAGDAYYLARAFEEAAQAYAPIWKKDKRFPLVGLKYARSLKQSGQYKKAINAFHYFGSKYKGAKEHILQDIIDQEILGCKLGQKLATEPNVFLLNLELLNIELDSLDHDLNAPLPGTDNQLYFTSNHSGTTTFYSAVLNSTNEGIPAQIADLPLPGDLQYESGCFSPDGERFYFSACSGNIADPYGFELPECAIYVAQKEDDSWSPPFRLGSSVNQRRSTNLHPEVIFEGPYEVLYFVSDRRGGKGGLDIWKARRDISAGLDEFSFPENLGKPVNTLGDEITPYFNTAENKLYFSSNSHVNLGGFDVFYSQKADEKWQEPVNLQLPVNSCNHDIFYRLIPDDKTGYLASNRRWGEKIVHSRNFRLYRIFQPGAEIVLEGNLFLKDDKKLAAGVMLELFDISNQDSALLLTTVQTDAGYYSFKVAPSKHYRLEAHKEGYDPVSFEIDLSTDTLLLRDLYLEPEAPSSSSSIPRDSTSKKGEFNEKGASNTIIPVPFPSRGRKILPLNNPEEGKEDEEKEEATAINSGETTFKIQLAAVKNYDPAHPGFRKVQHLGEVETEFYYKKALTRVLVSGYNSKQKAEQALRQITREHPPFKRAFIVKYKDDQRLTVYRRKELSQ